MAPSAQASSTVLFDPSGGTLPGSTLSASSFAFLPGNVDAVGGGGVLTVGENVHAVYEAILGSINTSGANQAALNGNTGNITTSGGGNTGNQVVITVQFTEQVTAFNGTTVTFAPNLGVGVNAVNMYIQSSTAANSASINISSGVGFPTQPSPPGSTLILTGKLTNDNFTSSFTENPATDPRFGGTPVPLNNHSTGSGSYAGINTIVGSGSTGLTVAVSSTNATYFTGLPPLIALNFTSISSGTPFTSVDPMTTMFTGAVPNTGTVNGVNGNDFLFQSQASTNFSVPEPSSILMGAIAVGFVSVASVRSRRRNASTTA